MGRNVKAVMDEIFTVLQEFVADDDRHEIADVERHIKADGDEAPVIEFVKLAKIKRFFNTTDFLCILEHKEQRHLLLPERYADTLTEIGLELESDLSIVQGAGMLAIAKKYLPLKKGIESLHVINSCLGITPLDPNKESITFQFQEIEKLFSPYCVAKLDDSRFQLAYIEDINRLLEYLMVDENRWLDQTSKTELKKLVLLLSSRSIAGSILNGVQNPLIEYTYLQLYQCIEYLFRLNNCFIIAEAHDVALLKSMDIVLAHEFKNSESENLYQVLRNNASKASIETIIGISPKEPKEDSDLFQKATEYIYWIRCNIAHLRYKQDDTSNVQWKQCVMALISIVLSIYQKKDKDIVEVCSNQGAWRLLSLEK